MTPTERRRQYPRKPEVRGYTQQSIRDYAAAHPRKRPISIAIDLRARVRDVKQALAAGFTRLGGGQVKIDVLPGEPEVLATKRTAEMVAKLDAVRAQRLRARRCEPLPVEVLLAGAEEPAAQCGKLLGTFPIKRAKVDV